jgi:hypothetical protein
MTLEANLQRNARAILETAPRPTERALTKATRRLLTFFRAPLAPV